MAIPKAKAREILRPIIAGVEQLVARIAHNDEVLGSSHGPATLWKKTWRWNRNG